VLLGKACYHSLQNLLSSRVLTGKLRTQIYRIVYPFLHTAANVDLYAWEEHTLGIFKTHKKKEEEDEENYIMKKVTT
jgi:hypothetical protein